MSSVFEHVKRCGVGPVGHLTVLLAAAMLLGPSHAAAQDAAAPEYTELPIPPLFDDPTEIVKARVPKGQILMDDSGSRFAAGRNEFDGYYNYLFATMTHLDQLTELPNRRGELYKDIATARNATVRDHLLNRTHGVMSSIASNAPARGNVPRNYHPGVRYNAMLIIGDLDSEGPDLIPGRQKPPTPYAPALATLVQSHNDPNQIEAVRVAALLGIHRHARYASHTWTDPQRRQIANMMFSLLRQTPEDAGRNAAGQVWMQRRAIEILASIGEEGPNGEIVALIGEKVADPKAPLSLRLTAAENLGRFRFAARNKPDVSEAAGKLASLAVVACQRELERIAREKKREAEADVVPSGEDSYDAASDDGEAMDGIGAYPGMPNLGGMRAGATQDDDYKMEAVRRRIKYQLNSVQLGLRGRPQPRSVIGGAAQEPALGGVGKLAGNKELQDKVTDVDKALNEIMAVMDKKDIYDLEALSKETADKLRKLKTLATRLGGAKAAPPADDPLTADPAELTAPAAPGALPGLGDPALPGPPPAAGN